MVMMRAAFDASMDSPVGITVVGGYIGTSDEWRRVEEKWLARLALDNMDSFRLTEVFYRYGFEGGLERTREFAQIICDSNLRSVCAHMLDTDWVALDRNSEYGRIYPQRQHACLDLLLGVLAEELNLTFRGIPVAVVFDNDYGNTAMAAQVYEAWRARTENSGFGMVAFTKGTAEWDVVPLQCADLLAGLVRRDPLLREHLTIPFSERQGGLRSIDLISKIRIRAMTPGRSRHWSITLAKDIENIRKKRSESEEGRSS